MQNLPWPATPNTQGVHILVSFRHLCHDIAAKLYEVAL